MRFSRIMACLLPPLLLAAAPPAADDPAATFSALAAVDTQLSTIGQRLVTANVALCDRHGPAPGWVLHALGQYEPGLRDAARARFGFDGPVAIETLVPGSPAAVAGIVAGDALLSVNGQAIDQSPPGNAANTVQRDAAEALVMRQPADAPLDVALSRGGQKRRVTVPATPGCAASFEVLLGNGMDASSDGRRVQIGVRFLARYSDAEVAAVVAHELAHVVLHHREQLEAAGVKDGMLAEVGRSGRLHRRAEDEADRLSVALLYNAGYDPAVAARFWRDHGGDVDGGLFRSRTHPPSKARAAAIDAEVAAIPAGAARPYTPAVLATRTQPMN
ncbi:M48 family metallopeptidase [Sphingomonas gellani]|nr:M48 family metallopeptidase [Sphingomonas gellani]